MCLVRESEALGSMPATAKALAEGEISSCAMSVLVGARERHPEEFSSQEEGLLEAARSISLRELRGAIGYWRQALEGPESLEDAEWTREGRRLHVSPTLGGTFAVDGDLDPETGQIVVTALEALVDAELHGGGAGDRRTSAQRRADALGEICRQWLDGAHRARVGGERPHVSVLTDVAALAGRAGGTHELEDVGPVHPQTVRRLSCDASIARVICRGRSEPLDIGRRSVIVPSPIRRAVIVRDGHCRFPGCDRPPPWCDAHHVRHWADGGVTALANLVLLCRRHHRLVHERGFGAQAADGRVVFTRPDGTLLEDRAPP